MRSPGGAMPKGPMKVEFFSRLLRRSDSRGRSRGSGMLGECARDLSGFMESLEPDFLATGERILDLYKRSHSLSDLSAGMADRLVGEEMSQAISGMEDALDQIAEYLAVTEQETGQGVGTLHDIVSRLEEVHAHLDGFTRLVRMLNILGVSTRIENARLMKDDTGFDTLAEAVKKLAQDIESRTGHIQCKSKDLGALVRDAVARAESLEQRRSSESHGLLERVSHNIASLKKRRDDSSTTARELSDDSREMVSAMGEIVSSMQFHDITRQQIDHVRVALLEVLSGKGGAVSPGVGIKAGVARGVLRIQSAQLRHSREELVSAVGRVKDNLLAISDRMRDMVEKIKMLTGAGADSGGSFLESFGANLAAVSASLKENDRINRELSESIGAVGASVGEIAAFVRDIDRVGLEIKQIALNSIIRAVHIGDEGKALGVLAQSIQRLSEDALHQTGAVCERLIAIQNLSGALMSTMGEGQRHAEGRLAQMEGDLNGLLARLQDADRDILEHASQMASEGEDLAGGIRSTSSGIRVHEAAASLLADIIDRMDEAMDVFSLVEDASPVKRTQSLNLLDHQKARYTMQAERDIHERHSGVALPPKPPSHEASDFASVELFDDGPATSVGGADPPPVALAGPDPEKKRDGEFGDNVELF